MCKLSKSMCTLLPTVFLVFKTENIQNVPLFLKQLSWASSQFFPLVCQNNWKIMHKIELPFTIDANYKHYKIKNNYRF